MKLIKNTLCSEARNHTYSFPAKRVLLPIGALLLISSAGSSFAQIDPTQVIDRSSSRPQTVSRNQLLAPDKALRAIERARKDIVTGHLEMAQKEISRALEIDPHFGVAKVMQGAIDLETKNDEGARTLFQRAIDDDPAQGGAYVGMAVVLIHEGRSKAALSLLDRAERLLPGAWFVQFAKGWAELELGDIGAALKQAESAERIAGTDPEKRSGVSYLRAIASLHVNEMDAAREHLAEAVARDRAGQYGVLAKRDLERLQPLLAAR